MSSAPTLSRSVGLFGAVMLGLGSILGTGAFVGLGLAVAEAGQLAIAALGIASFLALCNAMSSAQLAANHPVSGGTYAYGRKYIHDDVGFTAGALFLLAKSASAAAAAIGLTAYGAWALGGATLPTNLIAACVVIAITAAVALGLRRASLLNTILVTMTVLGLIMFIGSAGLLPEPENIMPLSHEFNIADMLTASALIFVAFTGYGRIATLGEEVTNPRKNIPLAILLTLGLSAGLYLGVLLSGIKVLGVSKFGQAAVETSAPLQAAAARLDMPWLFTALSVAAATAMAGVLLNLILGLSRVAFAMGRERDLPILFSKLNAKNEPVIAVWVCGAVITAITLYGGIYKIWSFSAFTVLLYYAITNLSALRLTRQERLYPRLFSVFGLAGCLSLVVWIDRDVMFMGIAVIVAIITARRLVRILR